MNDIPMVEPVKIRSGSVLNIPVHALNWSEVVNLICNWAVHGESKYICLCNVHSAVTAQSDQNFEKVLKNADLVLPDGMPLAWMLRQQGFHKQPRIGGPDLMLRCCERCAQSGISVFLYGSTTETLETLKENLTKMYPELQIAGEISPPFRDLSPNEELDVAKRINDSGAHVVFVALGCPRQEIWMERQRGKIDSVMIGLGAAFDFHAGNIRRAPRWMQGIGLEWLHRLASEPRRLWRRYLVTNTLFVLAVFVNIFRK